MTGRTQKWLAAFTIVLTLAALIALVGPARQAAPDVRIHAAIVAPEL